MTLCLSPGAIGVKADQRETIRLAAKHGFTAVEPFPQFLAGLDDAARGELLADLKSKGLGWGAAGLPVDFRGDDPRLEHVENIEDFEGALTRCTHQQGVPSLGHRMPYFGQSVTQSHSNRNSSCRAAQNPKLESNREMRKTQKRPWRPPVPGR